MIRIGTNANGLPTSDSNELNACIRNDAWHLAQKRLQFVVLKIQAAFASTAAAAVAAVAMAPGYKFACIASKMWSV